MQPVATPVTTRRNGKQQACEPCRRRKLACNHGYPVCTRCQKRGEEASCIYLAQPVPNISGPVPNSRPLNENSEKSLLDNVSSPGYLGPTSFSAFFQDAQNSLAQAELSSYPAHKTVGSDRSMLLGAQELGLSEFQMLRAVQVLQQLPRDERTALALFKQNVSPNDGWIRMAGEKLIVRTWQVFGSYLSESKLREMAEIVFNNTNQPLIEVQESNDAAAWLETFSGQQLRWESLAVIFAYIVLGATASSLPGEESRKLLLAAKECCSCCISWANSNKNANVLLVYALYKRSIIEACINGEASLAYWKDHTEAIAMLTFLGIHVQKNPTGATYQPTVISEIRRRLFCQIFIMDKVVATFVGRPPLLAWKYCTTPLPLDLDDKLLFVNDNSFESNSRYMNGDEWNPNPDLRASTIIRARTMIAVVREEILEIALGHTKTYSQDEIIRLKNRELMLYSELPLHVVYHFHENSRQVEPPVLYTKLLIRLEHLLNLFFLERLLAMNSGRVCGIDLLSTSFEMLSLTLVLWTHKDRLAGFQGEFEWLVMGHGAPAAGVLCNELINLNPLLAGIHVGKVGGVTLSRSSIIQQLSLLIGFLDWVGPSQPNSNLARIVKVIVEQVLDQTLNHTAEGSDMEFNFHADMNEFFNFDLLDTFDWARHESNVSHVLSHEGIGFGVERT